MVKYQIEEDFLNILLKGLDDTPDFNQDLTVGEGTPGPEEIAYNKSLNGLLETAYNQVRAIPTTNTVNSKIKRIDEIIKEYKNSATIIATKHLTETFKKYQDIANKKAEEKGFNTSKDDSILIEYLLPYQKNAINKNSIMLREKLVDLVYRLNYFGSAYHVKK